MEITELQSIYSKHPNIGTLEKILRDNSVKTVFLKGLCASSAALLASSFLKKQEYPFVFILGDLEEAGYFYHDLIQINGEGRTLFFPSSYRRAIKYGQKDAANEILRTEVLSRLQKSSEPLCIVTYPDALAEKVVSLQELSDKTLKLHKGEQVDTTFITEVLSGYGFERVDYVYEPGQYAVRGSIIDVFSFSSEYPFRIDFFGDEVESIRTFEVESQLSKERKESIAIVPELTRNSGDEISFLDFLPGNTMLAMKDFLWVRERIQAVHDEALSPQALAIQEDEERAEFNLEKKLIDGSEFTVKALDFRRIEFGNKPTGTPQATITFDCSPQPIFHKNFDLVSTSFKEYLSNGYTLYICSDSTKQTDRIRAIFQDRNDDIPFTALDRTLHEGFADNTLRCCFFTDHQIFDRFHKYNLKSDKARGGKVALTLKELNQFQPGDFVVHTDHGIGRFAGLVRLPNGNTTQEVIKLVYQNEDVVFVSIHSLHKVSKYKGKEGEPPRLNKLGTGAWEKMKERTKTKIKDIARDLIKLYSQRKEEKGFSFSLDSFMQHELEASFIYEDTPDQLKATQEVKQDMEKDRPMDRLICGDVGFGKTEVAIRAAFKAVSDNKQVAVLVPTTVLAYQHYKTFSERLKGFPCKVDYLSRARKPADAKRVLKELKEGEVSILIGTHRIIGKDVKFKDLGLLIVDEEHRFGVRHKERIKAMRANVDILTLTATPIPRTLNMAMSGMRDLSIIATPPARRLAVKTFVREYDSLVVREAILREILRGGQVYYLYNDVENIQKAAERLAELVPEARIAIGHGQMRERELERVMNDFHHQRFNVLVCTTIIETGIDIPTANTIIIERADHFGLAQLHQLRGRVGRSHHQAYAWLLTPHPKAMTTDAQKRLEAIASLEDLGAGFALATHDLEIRGAGELLGEEQSGSMETIGFSLYMELLENAVDALKAGREPSLEDLTSQQTEVELRMPSLLPDDFIPDVNTRLSFYKRIASAKTENELEEIKVELIDRFGLLPDPARTLLDIARLRQQAQKLGIRKLEGNEKGGVIEFAEKNHVNPAWLIGLLQKQPQHYRLDGPTRLKFIQDLSERKTRIEWVRQFMRELEENAIA